MIKTIVMYQRNAGWVLIVSFEDYVEVENIFLRGWQGIGGKKGKWDWSRGIGGMEG